MSVYTRIKAKNMRQLTWRSLDKKLLCGKLACGKILLFVALQLSIASCAGNADWTMNESRDKFQENLREILNRVTG